MASDTVACPSRRRELRDYMERGRLRDAVARDLSIDAQDLLVDIVARYCEDRRPPVRVRGNRAAAKGGTDGE